jgi:hypothetical protein
VALAVMLWAADFVTGGLTKLSELPHEQAHTQVKIRSPKGNGSLSNK